MILRHLAEKMHDPERTKSSPQLTTPKPTFFKWLSRGLLGSRKRDGLPRCKGRREGHQVPVLALQDSLGNLYDVRPQSLGRAQDACLTAGIRDLDAVTRLERTKRASAVAANEVSRLPDLILGVLSLEPFVAWLN